MCSLLLGYQPVIGQRSCRLPLSSENMIDSPGGKGPLWIDIESARMDRSLLVSLLNTFSVYTRKPALALANSAAADLKNGNGQSWTELRLFTTRFTLNSITNQVTGFLPRGSGWIRLSTTP